MGDAGGGEGVDPVDGLILRSAPQERVSKDGHRVSWFETALARLLTMRN